MRNMFPETDIYGITDSGLSLGRPVEEVVAALLEAGVRIIQYREKHKTGGEMLRECKAIRKLTREAGAFFIVNDHVALAMLVDADGVHVGQKDLPVPEVRRLVGERCVVGLSTHSPEEAARAVREGADYIGVGPIYATRTKEDVCDPVGLEYLDYIVSERDKSLGGMPFVAIGGIKRHNIGDVVRHGATCCCLVSELVGAEDIPGRVKDVRQAIAAARGL